ncbi:DUF3631 domain-containing protein [Ornithinimicrobium cryptoxanthini]|uniref:DUF3631 domain-containing protein n=1 Tax=Ornithinimicrobium cryptoxanthini TaxID=2934161 RepID=A0ABY4YF02_9MICO|nr:DUF3631 domain-containing protein [Ornithinimicrobium cryptoxanthini]USQ75356.1 DUF3631 domain-containing protein [Ornithinimicrobium cryptoxanthini]
MSETGSNALILRRPGTVVALPAREGIPISPHSILDDSEAAIRKYCLLPSEHAYVAVTLWAATTHVINAFDYAPRLVARSAEKQSGKSRLVEVLACLVHDPIRTVNVSAAFIPSSMALGRQPTILMDEADTIFGRNARGNENLRGLLNAGHQRGLTYGRLLGPYRPVQFPTFAMAMLAGIGRMPDTIEDRAVVLNLRRRKPTEKVAPFRRRRDALPLFELRGQLADWAEAAVVDLDGAEPSMPPGVEDRAADTWEPLLAVADLAGGAWPERARAACQHFVNEFEEDGQSQSEGVMLLADIREIFDVISLRFMQSADLCTRLRDLDDAPWKDLNLNPSKLGRRLAPYGIKTGHNEARSKRGYRRLDFKDAFERYLPADSASEGVQGRP